MLSSDVKAAAVMIELCHSSTLDALQIVSTRIEQIQHDRTHMLHGPYLTRYSTNSLNYAELSLIKAYNLERTEMHLRMQYSIYVVLVGYPRQKDGNRERK